MEVHIVTQFQVTLTPKELRLVSKGLRGILAEEDKAEALTLQERLMVARAQQIGHLYEEAQKAVTNIEKAKDGRGNR